jgi:hypothetical protein
MRANLNNLAGRFNLSADFLSYLSTLVNATIAGMAPTIVSKIKVVTIEVDQSALDTLNVEVEITPYYPGNTIKVKLVV